MAQAVKVVEDVAKKAAERPGETLERRLGNAALAPLEQGLKKCGLERDEVRRIFVANFKAGQLSAALLQHFPLAQVISDTNKRDFHVEAAKKAIDQRWPWRHVLRLGPWNDIVAQLREFDPKPFDLVVVDSQSNEVETIKRITQLLPFVRPGTPFVVVDALGGAAKNAKAHTRAPSQAWKRLSQFGALRTEGAVAFATPDTAHSFVILKC